MTTPREHADDKTEQTVTDALRRAFSLGKTYWQQAHSDFISQHVKADATRAKFQELCERTEDTIDTLRAQLAEAQGDAERWRRAAQCARLDQFGGFVITPDEPAFASEVSLAFIREIDAAIRAGAKEPSDG